MSARGMTKEQLIKKLQELRSRVGELERSAAGHQALRKTLEQSQQQLQLILDSAGEGIFGLDLDGNHTLVNPAAAKMLGYEVEELLGRPSHSTWHHSKPDGSPYPVEECPIHAILKEGTSHHVGNDVFWRKDGTAFPVAYSGAPLKENGRIVGAVVTFRDISERELYVATLRQERNTAQKYLDIAGVMLVVIAADQRVKLINKKGCEILGSSAAEIMGQNWFDNFLPERIRDQVKGLFTQLLTGELEGGEYAENQILTKNGVERLIAWHNTVLRDASGKITATLSSGEDITEKKQSEGELLNRKRELQTLHEISGIFLEHHSLKEALQVIVEEIGEVTGFPIVAIEFYQRDRQTLSFEAVRGIPRPAGAEEPVEVPADETLSGIVARTGQPLVETQARERPEYAQTSLRQLGVQTFVGLPLIDRQKTIGVLSLGHPEVVTIQDDFLRWTMSLANYLAALIVHRRQEEDLARQKAEFKAIFNSISDAVIYANAQRRMVMVNPAVTRMFGYTPEELVGNTPARLYAGPGDYDELERIRYDAATQASPPVLEITLRRRDGTLFPGETLGTQVKNCQGHTVGFLDIHRDITERKRLEEALQERMRLNQILLDAFPCVALLLRPHTREIVAANAAAVKVGAVPGTHCFSTWGQRQDPCPWCRAPEMWATGEAQHLEIEALGVFWDAHWIPVAEDLYMHFAFDITERKQTEQRYQTVIRATQDGYWRMGADGRILEVNDAYCRMTGYTREELLNMHISDLEAQESPAEVARHMQKVMEQGGDLFETQHRGKDGRLIDMEISTIYLPIAGGPFFIFTRDITQRKQAEEALRESEEKYRQLVSQVPALVFKGYADWSVDFPNGKVEELTGYRKEDFDSRQVKWCDLIHPEDLDYAQRVFLEALKGDRSYMREHRIRRKDGEIRWVQCWGQIICDAAGNIEHISGITFDVTDRKRAEEALRESEAQYRRIVETATEGIWAVDAAFRTTYVNQVMAELLGYTPQEMMGQPVMKFIFPEDLEDHEGKIAQRRQGLNDKFERRFRRRDGSELWTIVSAKAVLDAGGSFQGSFGMFTDITERKRAEEERQKMEAQLRQAQKMEAIGTLAGGIAHDFNNILSAIIGFGEMIEVFYSPQDPVLKGNLEEILKAAFRAKELVQQILTFSRKGEQDRRIMQLKPLIKESLSFLRASLPTTIEIRQTLEPEVGAIWADPTQMQQVVMNLCTNAAHAMGEKGGVLEVGLRALEVEPESVESVLISTPGPYIRLTVQDTGHGITPEILERIFDPYYTTKGAGEGTGLGLAVVDGIVKSHSGAITVASEPGVGTTFSVFFPRYKEREIPYPTDTPSPIAGGRGRILFVDDEPAIANLVKEALTILGYEVEASTGSLAALEIFRDRPEQFDLVITDLTMPQMSGVELAQELRRIRPDLPVILCTGAGDPFNQDHLGDLGFRELLRKPLGVRDLAEVIKKVLG